MFLNSINLNIKTVKIVFALFMVNLQVNVYAQVKPNSLFTDHMVLQQGVTVPVWGTAADGELVTVNFMGQSISTKASNGKWQLKLAPLKAGGPYEMTINGKNKITIKDILVGEVWLCSGQSNMERRLGLNPRQKPIDNWENESKEADYPQIRQFAVPRNFAVEPITDVNSRWELCTPKSVLGFSAVGYFFARDLFKKIHVPVGIIFSAVGGTNAESWTSQNDLSESHEFRGVIENYERSVKNYPARLARYQEEEPELMKKFITDSLNAVSNQSVLPVKPSAPLHPTKEKFPAGLFNGMIHPIIPYSIKGVCWYQGESNNSKPEQYASLLSLMISSWRRDFNQGDFPFLIVQVAPFKGLKPELREAQWNVTKKVANTSLIVTTDCGDANDIHPSFKQPVGERLAIAARALAYNEKVEPSGPQYESMQIKDSKVVLSFTHVGKGLVCKGDKLEGFVISDDGKRFINANATVSKDKVIVWADGLNQPTSVRYGWSDVPVVNLYNKDGLPAVPFRSDMVK